MVFNQAAMAAFADYTVANTEGRKQDLAGRDLNVDNRYGYQCMDLWIWARYRLGFTDNLPTPDAAAVWEMNWTAPENRMWQFFDAITPDQPAMPGDIFIMNRNFFGNGVGHIGMVLADLGGSIRVLELNGLNDGFETSDGGQHGSPARIHAWPKTYLYGYLRWIGPAPTVGAQSNTITPIEEEGFLMALSDADQQELLTNLRKLVHGQVALTERVEAVEGRVADITTANGPVSLRQFVADGTRAAQTAAANTGPITRGGKQVSLRQEVADVKTSVTKSEPVIVAIADAVAAPDVDGKK